MYKCALWDFGIAGNLRIWGLFSCGIHTFGEPSYTENELKFGTLQMGAHRVTEREAKQLGNIRGNALQTR